MKLSKVLFAAALVLCFAAGAMAQVSLGNYSYNAWDSDWPNNNQIATNRNLDIQNSTATTFSGKLDEGGGTWVEWNIINGTFNPTTRDFTFQAVVADPPGGMTINFAGRYGFGFVIDVNTGAGPTQNGLNGSGVYIAAPGQTGILGTYNFVNTLTSWTNGVSSLVPISNYTNAFNTDYLTISSYDPITKAWSGTATFSWGSAPYSGTYDADTGALTLYAFNQNFNGRAGTGFIGWWEWSQWGQTGQGALFAPVVPEPSTVAAMLTGLSSIGFFAIRRRIK